MPYLLDKRLLQARIYPPQHNSRKCQCVGGGMSFYIPKMPSKKLSILRDIKLLKELEVSKDDIIKAKKYELSYRTLRRIYDRS
ncbi:MAG: hypothetical protein MR782_03515 [Campylobacter sp.]|nr:hypothetical protein [Campylobacter sp.]